MVLVVMGCGSVGGGGLGGGCDLPLKNSGRNRIQYIVSRIRYQYSENLVADEKVYVNSIPFIVTYTVLIHSRYSLYKTKKDTVNTIRFIVTYTFLIQ